MIDNVRIMAKEEKAFVSAVRMFLQRSAEAAMTINPGGMVSSMTDKEIAEYGRRMMHAGYTFLGEHYLRKFEHNQSVGYVANSAKAVHKLKDALELMETTTFTRRQVAALVGLMLHMAHTINLDLSRYHCLIRAYSQMFKGLPVWDAAASELTPTFKAAIRQMASVLMMNKPVMIQMLQPPGQKTEDYDAVVIFDACQNAWAARVLLVKQKRVFRVMKAFAAPLQHSAHAEPTAAKEVCQWMKRHFHHARKVALVRGKKRWWSGNGGFSTAFSINEAFKEINGYAQVFHVEGKRQRYRWRQPINSCSPG